MRSLTAEVLDELLKWHPRDATDLFESAPQTRSDGERIIAREHAEAVAADAELAVIARDCIGMGNR